MTNLNKTVKNVLVIGLLGMTLTSCYKGKYKDQLRLNEELTQVNMGLESKITNLEDAVDIAQFKIEENAILIDGLEGDNSELSAQNAELGDVIVLLNTEITALKAALEASNGNSADLNDQLEAKTAALNDAIAKINTLSGVVDSLNAEIVKLKDIIAELQAMNASYVTQVNSLNNVISSQAVTINNYNTVVSSLTNSITTLTTQLGNIVPIDISSYTAEIARLDMVVTTNVNTIADRDAAIIVLQGQLANALSDTNADTAFIATLRAQIAELQADVININAANVIAVDALNVIITNLRADLATALDNSADEATIAQLGADLNAALDNSADIATIAQLGADLAAALDNSADDAEIARLDMVVTTNVNTIADRDAAIIVLQGQLANALSDTNADTAFIATLQARIAVLEGDIIDINAANVIAVDALNVIITNLRTQIATLSTNAGVDADEIVRLDLALSNANIMIIDLNADVANAIADTVRVQADLDALNGQVSDFANNAVANSGNVTLFGGSYRTDATVVDGDAYVTGQIIYSDFSTGTNGLVAVSWIVDADGTYVDGTTSPRRARIFFSSKLLAANYLFTVKNGGVYTNASVIAIDPNAVVLLGGRN